MHHHPGHTAATVRAQAAPTGRPAASATPTARWATERRDDSSLGVQAVLRAGICAVSPPDASTRCPAHRQPGASRRRRSKCIHDGLLQMGLGRAAPSVSETRRRQRQRRRPPKALPGSRPPQRTGTCHSHSRDRRNLGIPAGPAPRQRAVLVLHFYEDLPLVEVADVLDRPAATIRSDLRRALQTLRKDLA